MGNLKTETNSEEMEERVLDAFEALHPEHEGTVTANFEHDQWWVSCSDCGADFSTKDAEGAPDHVADGFSFERVTEGDGSCEAA